MKKALALLWIPLLLVSCSRLGENDYGTSLAEYNLRGKVKSEKLSIYNVSKKFGETKQGSLTKKADEHPLSNGYACSFTEVDDDYCGSIRFRTYDENGMVTELKWYNEDKKLKHETSYTYKDGLLVETASRTDYTYVPDNRFKRQYSYNSASGKLEKVTIYRDDDTVPSRTMLYKYNSDFSEAKVHVDWRLQLDMKDTVYTGSYDKVVKYDNGRPSMMAQYDTAGNENWSAKYDKRGFVVEEKGKKTTEYKYNEHGDPVSLTKDIDTYTFSYEYDKKHNWIKRTTYQNDEPLFIEVREIVYYD